MGIRMRDQMVCTRSALFGDLGMRNQMVRMCIALLGALGMQDQKQCGRDQKQCVHTARACMRGEKECMRAEHLGSLTCPWLGVCGQEVQQVVLAHEREEVEFREVQVGQATEDFHKQLGRDLRRLRAQRTCIAHVRARMVMLLLLVVVVAITARTHARLHARIHFVQASKCVDMAGCASARPCCTAHVARGIPQAGAPQRHLHASTPQLDTACSVACGGAGAIWAHPSP